MRLTFEVPVIALLPGGDQISNNSGQINHATAPTLSAPLSVRGVMSVLLRHTSTPHLQRRRESLSVRLFPFREVTPTTSPCVAKSQLSGEINTKLPMAATRLNSPRSCKCPVPHPKVETLYQTTSAVLPATFIEPPPTPRCGTSVVNQFGYSPMSPRQCRIGTRGCRSSKLSVESLVRSDVDNV